MGLKLIKLLKRGIRNHWHIIAVLFLAVIFFAGTSYYNHLVRPDGFVFWGSPDENANYIFTKLYGQSGEVSFFEKYNLYVEDIMHPRSIRSDWGNLKPVSFLGIILIYGKIVSFSSYKIIPYLTPFFAGLGIIFYYLLVKKLFGRRNALVSSFILASFPVYIYYSSRSMFHNVLFLVLFLASLYFSYLMVEKTRMWKMDFLNIDLRTINWFTGASSALGGFFLGLALITRTSEALWVAPVFFILWLFNFKRIGIAKLLVFLSFFILAWLPAGYWNQILFGAPFYSGYPEMNNSLSEIGSASKNLAGSVVPTNFNEAKETIKEIKNNIFYFGFKPDKSWSMLNFYFIKMFPWIFWPSILGLFLYFQKFYRLGKKGYVYLIAYAITSIILVLYYGSWQFYDNPDINSHTIGNSYTRYWLPIYLGAFPLFSLFLLKVTRGLFSTKKWIFGKRNALCLSKDFLLEKIFSLRTSFLVNGLRIVIVALLVLISLNFVFFGSEEGIFYSFSKQKTVQNSYTEIINKTESNSVIITTYYDKLLFPERKVIVGDFSDPLINEKFSGVANYLPVYYYNFSLTDKDLEYLNSRRLKEVGLSIDIIAKIGDNFTLYKLYKQSEGIRVKKP
ncbi:glycosyltransferase family 39 protein [bacterium]|nr:glycosyltransferase family 39 protein [bacterium]